MEIDIKLCFQPLIAVPVIGFIFSVFFLIKSFIVKTNNFASKQKFVIGSYDARRALSHFMHSQIWIFVAKQNKTKHYLNVSANKRK